MPIVESSGIVSRDALRYKYLFFLALFLLGFIIAVMGIVWVGLNSYMKSSVERREMLRKRLSKSFSVNRRSPERRRERMFPYQDVKCVEETVGLLDGDSDGNGEEEIEIRKLL